MKGNNTTGKQTKPAGGPATPLTKAEINQLKKEEAAKTAVIDNDLRNLGTFIGNAQVSEQSNKEEYEKRKEEINQSVKKSTVNIAKLSTIHQNAQREYEQRMSHLNDRISKLKQELADATKELEDLKAEKEKVLFEKDSVIENQKREMKEMAYQFSDMLMKTLITITEDFESQTSEVSKDETSGLPNPDRLKEFLLDRIHV
ncbi:hypothetical protein TVAG_486960 [Trichomonas vaginalis G3]|uniref:Dynein regulatory complex protein 12 n=1 Tax=Trichomonas vaginalis (strain ATCC PRA-98 / G3) TaxID=412133 RepID=A2DZC4_TRIV3|nr:hypothetical protein TVAGG3_1017230 [Trichomonas vaginalis G3]EAY14253.1 hypothetical protein TVAG_486960 [Trichomonas vaginalis G3]KAI5491889.1 hypothetical protein TVAGG3_1017230 [Trichomonas vaginalis G3]|eukprot:XP_001326476.1 hypothetical protein [Trichomonas vaginalis G3]